LRLYPFIATVVIFIFSNVAVVLAERFHWLGITRGSEFLFLFILAALACLVGLLSLEVLANSETVDAFTLVRTLRSAARDIKSKLFASGQTGDLHADWFTCAAIVMFFMAAFTVLLFKNAAHFGDQTDFVWHQIFLDYDLDWKTPTFSLGANLLNNFGIQLPLNTHLSPLIALSHLATPRFEVIVTVSLFYVAMGGLFWCVGRTIGLWAAPCLIFAGLVALIVTIPSGLEKFLLVTPPFLLTHLMILGLWWREATILTLWSVFLFFLLGQCISVVANLALALGFAVLCFATLLAYPEAAIFCFPIFGFYCFAFLLTARDRKEVLWKMAAASVLGCCFLLINLPQFFYNLYSYAFSVYFPNLVSNQSTTQLLAAVSLATYIPDFRTVSITAVADVTLLFLVALSSGALRRISIAVLLCEFGIIGAGIVNALTFRLPIVFFYCEQVHLAFLVAFFVLFLMAATVMFVGRSVFALRALDVHFGTPSERWAARQGKALCFAVPCLALAAYAVLARSYSTNLTFPPNRPPSVELLAREIGLKPGEPFRGRVITLVGLENLQVGDQWVGGPGSVFDIINNYYRPLLGNDHYHDLLAAGISNAADYGQWTSPVTYVFLRAFFGRKGDFVSGDAKAFFPLRTFNEAIARLIGVRMVITDADALPGGKLIYETTAGAAALRIFRVAKTNLGQYSPIHALQVTTAAEAIDAMVANSFNPENDVIVESSIPHDLVAGKLLSLTTDYGPTLSVSAMSLGWSLLVLPFEYSHCLRLQIINGATAAILPVNLQQTGLLFEHTIHAEISYDFGPLTNVECRGDDRRRVDILRVRDALRRLDTGS
jgi:hypothetical protein